METTTLEDTMPATTEPDWDDEDYEGPCCTICDGLGHGYPGGPPCPLEVTDYSDEPWWAV